MLVRGWSFDLSPQWHFGSIRRKNVAGCPISRAGFVLKKPREKWESPKFYFRAVTGSRSPASLASFAALSVDSQVKSGSVRPK